MEFVNEINNFFSSAKKKTSRKIKQHLQCKECGEEIVFCKCCGKELSTSEKRHHQCSNCKEEIVYCECCGNSKWSWY